MAKPSEMSQNSKREYLEKMKWRYERRGREGRSVLLDELCEVCGYSRKHAIKLMNGSLAKNSKPRGRRAVYGAAELAVIKPIWLAANQPCGKLLAPLLPIRLGHWEAENGPIEPETRARLERISASTLESPGASLRTGPNRARRGRLACVGRLRFGAFRCRGRHLRCASRRKPLPGHQARPQITKTNPNQTLRPGVIHYDATIVRHDHSPVSFFTGATRQSAHARPSLSPLRSVSCPIPGTEK